MYQKSLQTIPGFHVGVDLELATIIVAIVIETPGPVDDWNVARALNAVREKT